MSQLESMIQNLKANTGRTLDEWLAVLDGAGLEKHGEMMKLLKGEHGVSHGYANLVVQVFRNPEMVRASGGGAGSDADPGSGGGTGAGPDLVEAQYRGKESLRPIYERLVEAVEAFGDDVEIAPKKTYVSLRRSKQFGLIQPSTRTRVDVGVNLKGKEPSDRLELSGSFNSMVSHRVRVTDAGQVDDELVGWLREAYEAA